jgi:hypothetical protein
MTDSASEYIHLSLQQAVRNANVTKVTKVLLTKGCPVNETSHGGVTPLIIAAGMNLVDVTKALLARPEIRVNQALLSYDNQTNNMFPNQGGTALHEAAMNGHTDIVRLLLQHPKINVALKNKDGNTAEECAQQQEIDHLFQLYRAAHTTEQQSPFQVLPNGNVSHGITLPSINANDTPLSKAQRKEETHTKKCAVCGEPSKKRCTRCKCQRYCSSSCQKTHWKKHRKFCAVAPTSDMAGAARDEDYKIIVAFTEAASKAGRKGEYGTEIRMLKHLITTLPGQLDSQFCMANAHLNHKQPKKAIKEYLVAFQELHDNVKQWNCLKNGVLLNPETHLPNETAAADFPHLDFPSEWRIACLPEEMIASYLAQQLQEGSTAVEKTIRGRCDLELEMELNECMIEMIEYSERKVSWLQIDPRASCRVMYVAGETCRKMSFAQKAESYLMTADGYHIQYSGVHDFCALTAVPDLCMHQAQECWASVQASVQAAVQAEQQQQHDLNPVVIDAMNIVKAHLKRGVSVSRLMKETAHSKRDAQEYTTVQVTLPKTIWNYISITDKVVKIGSRVMEMTSEREEWKVERDLLGKEAYVLAKSALKDARKGYFPAVPQIDAQNVQVAQMLMKALEEEGFNQ